MKKLLVMAIILLIFNVSATCNNGQIDINNAGLEGLDKLMGVGPATAQNIIDARPYKNVDELIEAIGIGEVKLSQIKDQGLACVGSEGTTPEEEGVNEEDIEDEENKKEVNENDEYNKNEYKDNKKELNVNVDPIVGSAINEAENEKPTEIIRLNSKDIKSENVKEGSNTTYWLLGFVVLLGFLFLVRNRKQKTEFDD